MESKLKAYLGFAIKGGKVIFGYDNLLLSKKMPELVLICKSQNEKVTNKVINFCTKNNIECIKLNIVLSDIVGRNCKVLGVTDKNLSQATTNVLKMGNQK